MIDIPGRFCRLAAPRSGGLGSTKGLQDGRRRLLFSPRLPRCFFFWARSWQNLSHVERMSRPCRSPKNPSCCRWRADAAPPLNRRVRVETNAENPPHGPFFDLHQTGWCNLTKSGHNSMEEPTMGVCRRRCWGGIGYSLILMSYSAIKDWIFARGSHLWPNAQTWAMIKRVATLGFVSPPP